MRFCFNDMMYSFSFALDCVEHDLLGVTTFHGQRVACLCALMGRELGMEEDELLDLAACAILHDNALTQYIQEERLQGTDLLTETERIEPSAHCVMGEQNLKELPLKTDMTGSILYHHENADGTGPFGKTAAEVPIYAQLIHIADQVDIGWDLSFMTDEKFERIRAYVSAHKDREFSSLCVDLFLKACGRNLLAQFQREKALVVLQELLPYREREYSDAEVVGLSNIFAKIIDYKSHFTRTHSLGIAQKARRMGEYYGCPPEEVTKLYFAGALHDIGKLVVDRDILEKPGSLTDREYEHIQNHAYHTFDMLRRIKGLEDVTLWAALHHEKLNGKGYPFGKTAVDLNRNERLMGCLDIYQALTEQRPYKEGMSHEQSIGILRDMAKNKFVDAAIVEDLNLVFAESQ